MPIFKLVKHNQKYLTDDQFQSWVGQFMCFGGILIKHDQKSGAIVFPAGTSCTDSLRTRRVRLAYQSRSKG